MVGRVRDAFPGLLTYSLMQNKSWAEGGGAILEWREITGNPGMLQEVGGTNGRIVPRETCPARINYLSLFVGKSWIEDVHH